MQASLVENAEMCIRDRADAVLVIPAGFGDALMDAARTGGDLPELEAATGGDMQAAALASRRASRTVSLIASRAALTPHASAEQVLDGMRKLSDIAPAVDTIETTEESTAEMCIRDRVWGA